MFQQSFVESSSLLRGHSRGPAGISFAWWGAIAVALVVMPLMHAEDHQASRPVGIAGTSAGPQVEARPDAAGPVRVSWKVMSGQLLEPLQIEEPKIAKLRREQGTVVVVAVISRTGQIESARVVSGPELLQAAVLQAVRAARYRPYLLDGLPTEVETTIRIGFSVGN
jgi:TonB family protein